MSKLTVIALIMSLVIPVFFVATSADAGALDGKTFTGEMGEKGNVKGDKEQVEFSDGKFHSIACDAYGFTAAPYTESVKGNTTTFKSETSSPTEGKMSWSGTVKGELLEGTVVWNKDGQAAKEYWIKANLQK